MVKKMQLGTKTPHCFSECPDIAGVELQTVINSALRQLNVLIDNTYNAYKSKYPMATRPKLYVYIVENKIDEINAFTDGQDIYIAAACMIGMHSYIKERLDTKKVNGERVVPKGLEVSSETRIYKYVLELIVAHELTHIWHSHSLWTKDTVRVKAPMLHLDDVTIFTEKVLVSELEIDEAKEKICEDSMYLTTTNGKLVVEHLADLHYLRQILEVDADCGAMNIVMMDLQHEINDICRKNLVGGDDQKRKEMRAIMGYHSYLIGLLMGAAGIMCGFFDSKRVGKPFDRLATLLASDHPVPAIRFLKMQATLLAIVHDRYPDESVAKFLLSETSSFAIDIFMHDGTSMDLRNCFWAPAQTKDAQEFISLLDRGWNIIRDSLQKYALTSIPDKYTDDQLKVQEGLIWYDSLGNPLKWSAEAL